MKLRGRLALALAVLVIPFAVGLALLQTWQRRAAMEQAIAETVRTRMLRGERAICEADPEAWPERPRMRGDRRGRHGPGSVRRGHRRHARHARRGREGLFAYDASFRSRNPDAPPFDPELRAELEQGDRVASDLAGGDAGLVAVRMPWDEGPCAIVVVRRPVGPAGLRALMRTLWPSLLVSLAAVLLAVVAAGPIVRRIRRLTEQVHREEPLDVGGRDEVADLAKAFEDNRHEIQSRMRDLQSRDAALTSYVANTTHDVMLPLTVLQGHLTAIRQQIEAGSSPERELVDRSLEESHYLVALLHNMSAAAKLEAGDEELARHPVDVAALVERVIARHEPIARHKNVELNHAVPDEPAWVQAEPTLLEQAISNLVHNAIRHNDAGGHVAVVLEHEDGETVLRVVDDGPGLSDARLAEMDSGRFTDPEARDRPRGLGLGLQIARDVADRHGFRLRFERPDEGGLAVELRIPEG